jgi:hypothetical protein
MQVAFITFTMIMIIVIAWMEILDILGTTCKGINFQPINLLVRFGFYLISRFYLVSTINIELLSKKPYEILAWKGLWPPAFQATSFMMIADIFTFDYVECLPFHQVFSLSTAFIFSLISLGFTVGCLNKIFIAIVSAVKSCFSDEVEVSDGVAKITNYVFTSILCLMLLFCNSLFMILTYSQIADSAPLLYIEYILYYSMLIIWLGRISRAFYKRLRRKNDVEMGRNLKEKNPVIGSDPTGKKVISLEVIRLNTEAKGLK